MRNLVVKQAWGYSTAYAAPPIGCQYVSTFKTKEFLFRLNAYPYDLFVKSGQDLSTKQQEIAHVYIEKK